VLRIRKIRDTRTAANRAAVEEAQQIIRKQFPGLPPEDVDKLPAQLDDPFRYRFVSELFVLEDGQQRVRAVALVLYDPEQHFSYLEIISTAPGARRGSGVGGALYDRIRQEAATLGSLGLYFECLPDDPETSPDPAIRKQNAARLKFYERYGAFPIVGTLYCMPVRSGDTDMPVLVFDGLGRHTLPKAAQLRRIVRAILERKYADLCPPDYVDKVVGSIRDGAFALRQPRYAKPDAAIADPLPTLRGKIPLIVNDRHDIHNIAHDRGYVEAPVRIRAILRELDKTGFFERVPAKRFPDRFIREVHDPSLLEYMERACREAPEKKSVYPYVFPIRNPQRKPRERSVLAGYWCIDTFTPLNRNVWPAARQAADCALTAAERVLLNGAPLAYALVRPPGHHAERRTFGGFCYLCNPAIAANYLSRYGRVAILDIDYHHGNGQQDIFYERDDVLTVSIHGHPSFAYPYFSGFRDETGRGRGAGYNINIPLPETVTPEQYREAVATALRRIGRYAPAFLILSLGLDTGRGDPTGTWGNRAADFRQIGRMIGEAGYPTVVVQEGGYRVSTLGVNASGFFSGLVEGAEKVRRDGQARPAVKAPRNGKPAGLVWREAVRAEDIESVRMLVAGTAMFSAEEIDIAAELVMERIEKGRASGYEFILAEDGGKLAGYACFGPIPGSETSYDLYWIAVNADRQGRGLGRDILARSEEAMRRMGARHIYVDTSSSEKYIPTRGFYLSTGYAVAAEFADFYRPGDGKVIFVKKLAV
jgi:acetoin utilization deacetylase AcuC-like enzyme/N-acetylglutamate synthase-like GNAT family acetyltransferase